MPACVQVEGEEEIEIEYVSAPMDFGPEEPKEDEEEERPGLGGLGFGLGMGFPEPKVSLSVLRAVLREWPCALLLRSTEYVPP